MAEYINSFIALFVGFYAILLGQGIKLPPASFRNKEYVVVLGVILVIGGIATLMFTGPAVQPAPKLKPPVADIIAEMKRKKPLPVQIDSKTRLEALEADDTMMIYTVTILEKGEKSFQMADAIIRELPKQACTNNDYITFFKLGVTLEMKYMNEDGKHVGTLTLAPELCGY